VSFVVKKWTGKFTTKTTKGTKRVS